MKQIWWNTFLSDSDAKLGSISLANKKIIEILFHLLRQQPLFATKARQPDTLCRISHRADRHAVRYKDWNYIWFLQAFTKIFFVYLFFLCIFATASARCGCEAHWVVQSLWAEHYILKGVTDALFVNVSYSIIWNQDSYKDSFCFIVPHLFRFTRNFWLFLCFSWVDGERYTVSVKRQNEKWKKGKRRCLPPALNARMW